MTLIGFVFPLQGGAKVNPSDRIEINEKPDYVEFKCKKAVKGDSGTYAVTLSNEAGNDTVNLDVTVVCKYHYLIVGGVDMANDNNKNDSFIIEMQCVHFIGIFS